MADGEDGPQPTAALAVLEATDPNVAYNARLALRWITGEDLDRARVTVRAVQDFCWHDLPLEDLDDCEALTDGLARLLDLLQMPRHAAVCRSPATQTILEAYWKDESEGLKAYRRAATASGLAPPALPGLEWGGEEKPPAEAAAWQSTARMLEQAVTAGDLVPGARGWKDRQQELAQAHLDAPRPELGGRSLAEAVIAERIDAWADGHESPTREEAISQIADRMLRPARFPDQGAAASPTQWQWFMGQLDDGISLTQNGNISRAFVRMNAARFGWSFDHLPSFEKDLDGLHMLRAMAARLRLAGQSGRKLVLTPRGRRLSADPAALWQATARLLISDRDFEAFCGELFLVLLLSGETLPADEVNGRIAKAVAEEEFVILPYETPPDKHDVSGAANYTIHRCRALGLFAPGAGSRWLDSSYQLTAVGAATALEALRAQAARPLLPADIWADPRRRDR
jgi:hypothetical protein